MALAVAPSYSPLVDYKALHKSNSALISTSKGLVMAVVVPWCLINMIKLQLM
jgi:hypothetical protein